MLPLRPSSAAIRHKKSEPQGPLFFLRACNRLIVELELGEAVVNRVAIALDAVILVIAKLLDVESQSGSILLG
jgi:hypothetical protein